MNIASTVKQTTLMPPTTPPMMGPRGTDLSDAALTCASLVADESGIEGVVSVVVSNEDVVGGGVVDGVCDVRISEVALRTEVADGVVDELVESTLEEEDDVDVADTEGGFA